MIACEEFERLTNGEIQYIGNRVLIERDLKNFFTKSLAIAIGAAQIDI